MPCPTCGSNDLWDDNLAWGCNRCPWFTTGSVQNTYSRYDTFRDPPSRSAPPPAQEPCESERAFFDRDEAEGSD